MADPVFAPKPCYPGLDRVPAIGGTILSDCTVPDHLDPAYVCPTFDFPPTPPAVPRQLYIRPTRGPVSGYYDWAERVADGQGGWAAGPRSGLIAASTWATELNGTAVDVAAGRVYPATLVAGTGRCVFLAALPAAQQTLYLQLTAYHGAYRAYDWRQVVSDGAGGWTPTGATGTAAAGTGVAEQNGLPAAPDGTTVHAATADSAGNLVVNSLATGSGVIALTPAGGIPAATDATHPGSATVDYYYLTAAGFVAIGYSGTMYNMDPNDPVSGNAYVQGKVTPGLKVLHDYEICAA